MLTRNSQFFSKNIRRFASASSGGDAPYSGVKRTMMEVPAWGILAAGMTAAGFFGKVLHDDNLATRKELHDSVGSLRTDLRDSIKEIKEEHKELRQEHKELRQEHKELRKEVYEGFKELKAAIEASKEPPRRSSWW